jgi:hypothetical protein
MSSEMHGVASVDEAIRPVDDAPLHDLIARAIRVGVGHERGGRNDGVAYLVVRVVRGDEPLLADVALGMEVSFLRDGEVAHTESFALMSMRSTFPGTWGYWVRMKDFADSWDESDPADLARWRVRITGSGDQAIKDLNRESYWAGMLEYPLMQVLRRGEGGG